MERIKMALMDFNENQQKVMGLLKRIKNSQGIKSLNEVANFLGYELSKNPVNPDSDWHLLYHNELDKNTQALIALIYDENLNDGTIVRELRKRYEQVDIQREKFRGFTAYLYGFIGNGRILIFKGYDSNRDERLDVSEDSVKMTLTADNFLSLSCEKVKIEEDEFGFGKEVVGLDKLFTQTLANDYFRLTMFFASRKCRKMQRNLHRLAADICIKFHPMILHKKVHFSTGNFPQ